MNPLILEVIIKDKHEDMLREAHRQRLINQFNLSRGTTTSLRKWIFMALGDLLINAGKRLQHHYGTTMELREESCVK